MQSNRRIYILSLFLWMFALIYANNIHNVVWNPGWEMAPGSFAPPHVAQQTRYYPSGLPKVPLLVEGLQPYKYGSKEYVEAHGWDMYDSGARWYYATTMRTTSPDPLAERHYDTSPYAWCGNNPMRNIDPTGMDYWTTNDPDEISRFLSALQSGGFGGSWKSFEDFDYSDWGHVTDAQFLSGLTYNDESRMFHSSYGTVINNEFFEVGVSIPALSDYNGSATVKTKQGEWWDRASGRLELDNSLFNAMLVGKGIISTLENFIVKGVTEEGINTIAGTTITGFTKHGTNQAITRGFKTPDILKIVKEGNMVEAMGRFGPQMRYTLGGNTVVINSRGKIISVFSNAPASNGLVKGHFIPFD